MKYRNECTSYFVIYFFALTTSHTQKKCWIHGNFLLPVFDGSICFRRSYK